MRNHATEGCCERWGLTAAAAELARLREERDALLEAAKKAERIELLHDELSTNYARINGAGRTTSAESTMLAKAQVAAIREELRSIREGLRAAIARVEGR